MQYEIFQLERTITNAANDGKVNNISKEDIEKATKNLLGSHIFSVPMYSAIKVNDKSLYWDARNNKRPSHIPEKPMIVAEKEEPLGPPTRT